MKKIIIAIVLLLVLSSISFAVIRVDISDEFTEFDPIWNSEKANYVTSILFNSIGNWSADKDNYFNKTQVNSTGFIGLVCSSNQIMRWSGFGWVCANEASGGISQIFSGNQYAYITGGDTVNVNITAISQNLISNKTIYFGSAFTGSNANFNRTMSITNVQEMYVDGIRWEKNFDYVDNTTDIIMLHRLWNDQTITIYSQ